MASFCNVEYKDDKNSLFFTNGLEYETIKKVENINDDLIFQSKTNPFIIFMKVSTNFSSYRFLMILNHIIVIMEKVEISQKCLMKKLHGDQKTRFELTDISNFFARMVSEIKYNAKMILLFLEAAIRHINVVASILKTSPCNKDSEWSNADKQDIKIAVKALAKGAKKLMCFSKSAKRSMEEFESNQYKNCQAQKCISCLKALCMLCEETSEKNNLSNKQISDKVEFNLKEKQEVTNSCVYSNKIIFPIEHILFPLQQTEKDDHKLSGWFKNAKLEFGKVDLPLTNETSISSMIWIHAYALGNISQSVKKLANELYNQKQLEDLYELNKLVDGLIQLDSEHKKVMYCMAKAEETVNYVLSNIETIQVCLENKRQLEQNREICSLTIQSTMSMIECLKKI